MVLLERELQELGKKMPLDGGTVDWQATVPKGFEEDSADENETADKMEEFGENTAVLNDLENKYDEIKNALAKIDKGNYGMCEVCNEPIEEDRLIANPAATTCKVHME